MAANTRFPREADGVQGLPDPLTMAAFRRPDPLLRKGHPVQGANLTGISMEEFDALVERIRTRVKSHSGADPTGRFANAATLRALVSGLAPVPLATRTWFLDEIERRLIRGADLVDSFKLGIAIGTLSIDNQPEGFMEIRRALSDLDRLPIVANREGSVQ